jgi:hypothetical protein
MTEVLEIVSLITTLPTLLDPTLRPLAAERLSPSRCSASTDKATFQDMSMLQGIVLVAKKLLVSSSAAPPFSSPLADKFGAPSPFAVAPVSTHATGFEHYPSTLHVLLYSLTRLAELFPFRRLRRQLHRGPHRWHSSHSLDLSPSSD